MTAWKKKNHRELVRAIQSLKNEDDLLNFLRDIATLEELDALATRWEAARLLDQGVSYRDVAKKTGLSTATVTRVAHWLHHGEGGYTKALRT